MFHPFFKPKPTQTNTKSQKSFNDNNKSLQQAIGYCLGILARKDYSRLEMIQKLEKRIYSQSIIYEVMQYLESKKFVDDFRIAENIIHYYYGQKGKVWIKQKMETRLIPEEIINSILQELPSEINHLTEVQINSLKRILSKKYQIENWQNIEIQTKGKIFQYLLRNGFSQPVALLKYLSKDDN